MVKIVIGDPVAGLATGGRRPGHADVAAKRIVGEDGKPVTVYTLDANSETLSNDMFTVFRRNVARARRAHRDLVKKHGTAAE